MDNYYFIIRVREYGVGYYKGTFKELSLALESIGARIIGEEDAHVFNRVGLDFDKRLFVKTLIHGKDMATYNDIMEDIVSVFERHGIPTTRNYIELIGDLKSHASIFVDFETDKLDVLVSDGVFRPEPGVGYIGVYSSYKPFSEFDERAVWDGFGRFCGMSMPVNAK